MHMHESVEHELADETTLTCNDSTGEAGDGGDQPDVISDEIFVTDCSSVLISTVSAHHTRTWCLSVLQRAA